MKNKTKKNVLLFSTIISGMIFDFSFFFLLVLTKEDEDLLIRFSFFTIYIGLREYESSLSPCRIKYERRKKKKEIFAI